MAKVGSLKTIRVVDNTDGSLTMVQVRENQNDLVAIREMRELTVGKDWINTGTWKVTELVLT